MDMILIRNGLIIDGTGRNPLRKGSILIKEGRFAEITDGEGAFPPDAAVVDANGKTIIPGLIDMHSHLLSGGFDSITDVIDAFDPATQKRALKQMLYWGVTATYSPVQPVASGLQLRAQLAQGDVPGPRLFISGPGFTAPNGWAGSFLPLARMEPKNLLEAEQQVTQLAEAGVDILKIYYDTQCCAFLSPLPQLETPIMERIIATAHQNNLKVMVHAYDNRYHIDALRAGVDILAHSAVTTLVDNEYLDLASKAGALYLATLSVYHDAFDEESLRRFIDQDFVQASVPRQTLDTLAAAGPLDEFLKITKKSYIKDQLPTIQANLKRVSDSGIPVGVGPDTGVMGAFPGISVHREMELMVQAGLSPTAVLTAATRTAAEYLGEQSLGTIEQGKIADLVIINGNPLEDIRNTRNIEMVIKEGRVVNRENLLHEILGTG
ncbi:MAG: amidohydrolase family protein [Pyrinomonadaceae bacterium]